MSAVLYGLSGVGAITLLDNAEGLFGIGNNGNSSNSSGSSSIGGLSVFDWLLIGGGLILIIVLVEK